MKTQDTITIGTVSHGTLRAEDLLGKFLFTLEKIDPNAGARFNAELISLGFGYSQCGACGMGNRDEWPEGFDDDMAQEIISEMMDSINAACPAGIYFGAHYGDGSDFGFWEIIED
jgi:hypothetical protein